jgi:signal peptidase II
MIKSRAVWPWYAGAAGLVILDQVSKALIRHFFVLHQSIPILGQDFLRLTYVLNPGIAFGVSFFGRIPLLIFGWGASVALSVYLYRLIKAGDPLRWPIVLFLAGALGNAIDRLIFAGKVTDFIDVDFPDIIMERWPVFNVADSCVTVGITLLAVMVLVFNKHPAKPVPHDQPSHPTAPLPTDDGSGTTTPSD